MDVSVKRVDKKEFESEVEDAQAEQWKLKSKSDNVALFEKPGGFGGLGGHAIVFLLSVWWTFGLGNVAYAVFRYFTDKKELRIKVK